MYVFSLSNMSSSSSSSHFQLFSFPRNFLCRIVCGEKNTIVSNITSSFKENQVNQIILFKTQCAKQRNNKKMENKYEFLLFEIECAEFCYAFHNSAHLFRSLYFEKQSMEFYFAFHNSTQSVPHTISKSNGRKSTLFFIILHINFIPLLNSAHSVL